MIGTKKLTLLDVITAPFKIRGLMYQIEVEKQRANVLEATLEAKIEEVEHLRKTLNTTVQENYQATSDLRGKLKWAMNNMHIRSNAVEFVGFVLKRGGTGDTSDCMAFFDQKEKDGVVFKE